MKRSEQINELATALAKAQGQIRNAKKDANNPHFNSDYATFAALIDAVKEPLSVNGLAYIQSLNAEKTHLETLLVHSSGQWIEGQTPIILEKQNMQGLKSANTYAAKIGLSGLVGVTQMDDPSDDDGNAASASVHKNHTNVLKNDERLPNIYGEHASSLAPPGWPGSFPIPLKLKKRVLTVGELSNQEVKNDITYWLNRSKNEGKPLTGDIAAYVEALEAISNKTGEPNPFENDVP